VLQYFTSAQFFAQARRQVMGRPQATQGLLGRACLLPRKEGLLDTAPLWPAARAAAPRRPPHDKCKTGRRPAAAAAAAGQPAQRGASSRARKDSTFCQKSTVF